MVPLIWFVASVAFWGWVKKPGAGPDLRCAEIFLLFIFASGFGGLVAVSVAVAVFFLSGGAIKW